MVRLSKSDGSLEESFASWGGGCCCCWSLGSVGDAATTTDDCCSDGGGGGGGGGVPLVVDMLTDLTLSNKCSPLLKNEEI